MKFFLDLEYVSSIPNAYNCNSNRIMQITGLNTGNFAFRHALLNLIPNIEEFTPVTWTGLRNQIEKGNHPEKVIVSCANWLCASEQYEKSNAVRASIIKSLKCDIVAFGLGAQASKKSDDLVLGRNTVELAHALASKCHYISVRDEFTCNILKKYNIYNSVITGCPSNFINNDIDLGNKIVTKLEKLLDLNKNWPDSKVLFSEFSGGHSHSGLVLERILTLLSVSSGFYSIQTPNLYPFFLGESDDIHPSYLSNMPKGYDNLSFRKLLRTRVIGFSSIEHWMDFSRVFDFSVGMRIHGKMRVLF